MEATKCANSFPLFDDPWWGEPSWQHEFIKEWNAKYGPGTPGDVHRKITGIDWDHVIMLKLWAHGAQLAGTFDPDKILEALRAAKSIPTILGPGVMYGKEMWGIDNMISPPIPIAEVKADCKCKRIQAHIRFEEWFEGPTEVTELTHGAAFLSSHVLYALRVVEIILKVREKIWS
jgi:hypothetical protein